jgi:sarcinarray family protein
MRVKLILIVVFCIALLTETVAADSPYGKMEVYYNNKLLPGSEVAKPILKIGEPFTVGINLTVSQKSEVSVELSEIGDGYFKIINGSTSKMNTYRADVVEKTPRSSINGQLNLLKNGLEALYQLTLFTK